MTQFDRDEEGASGRRIGRFVETNKDAVFAKYFLLFSFLTASLIVGAILFWFVMTQQHLNQAKQQHPIASKPLAPIKKKRQTSAATLFGQESFDAQVDIDEIFQKQEKEVVLMDLKPEVRDLIERYEKEQVNRSEGEAVKGSLEKKKDDSPQIGEEKEKLEPFLKKQRGQKNQRTEGASLTKKEDSLKKSDMRSHDKKTLGKSLLHKKMSTALNNTIVIAESCVDSVSEELKDLPVKSYGVLSLNVLSQKSSFKKKSSKTTCILEVQMEPLNASLKVSKNALKVGMSEKEIEEILLPYVSKTMSVGIRNQMGSAFLADDHSLKAFMSVLKKHHLFFVDAVTGTYDAATVAQNFGVPYYKKTLTFSGNVSEQNLKKKMDSHQNRPTVIFVPASKKVLADLRKTLNRS